MAVKLLHITPPRAFHSPPKVDFIGSNSAKILKRSFSSHSQRAESLTARHSTCWVCGKMKTRPRIYIYWDLPELQSVYTRDYNDLCKKILYFRRVAAINPSVCLETVAGRFRPHEDLKELSHKDITPDMAWEFRSPRKIVLSSFSIKSHRQHHSS